MILMNLENIMLRERSQSQKTTYYMIPLLFKAIREVSIETESRLLCFLRWGENETGLIKRTGFLFKVT